MNLFTCNLNQAVSLLLSHAGENSITTEKALEVLTAAGIEVPGETYATQILHLRSLFAWIKPEVAIVKRGRRGGLCKSKYAAAKKQVRTNKLTLEILRNLERKISQEIAFELQA